MIKDIHTKLFYLFLLLLPSQLNYYFWPIEAFVLGRRVDYLAPSIYGVDILMVLFLGLWLWDKRHRWRRFIKRNSLSLLLLIILITINCYISQRPTIAFYHWLMWIKLGLLGVYIYTNNHQNRLWTVVCLTLGLVWTSILGNVQFITNGSIGGLFYYLGERTFSLDTPNIAKAVFCPALSGGNICITMLRTYGTFPHPNVLAGYIIFILLLLWQHKHRLQLSLTSILYSILKKHSRVKQIVYFLWWLLTIYLIISLLLTFSRSGVVALLVGTLWYTKRCSLTIKRLITFFTSVFILLSTIPIVPFNSLTELAESFVTRQQLNNVAFIIILNNSLFGVGLSHFLISLPVYFAHRSVYFLQPVHNIYLLLLSELGIIGIMILVTIFVLVFRNLRVAVNISLLLPFLIIGLADHYLLTLHHGQLLLLFVLLYSFKIISPTSLMTPPNH